MSHHLIGKALAGTGKTTTSVEGINELLGTPSKLSPSNEQRAIWDAMKLETPKSVKAVAFNKSIASVLQDRLPSGATACTLHSLGYATVRNVFRIRRSPNAWRTKNHLSEIEGKDIKELFKHSPEYVQAVDKLVGLSKLNLADGSADSIDELTSHYDVDLNGSRERVLDVVPRLLERAKDVDRDGYVDFNDMVALPSLCNLPVEQSDLLVVDEAQDLNRAQQGLALKAIGKGRGFFIGDPNQAIYGFAGADSESMNRLNDILAATDRGVQTYPLTETRRCSHAVVAEAQQIVPDFRAHPDNPLGSISRENFDPKKKSCYRSLVQPGDMAVCRVNAPLVSECFYFLRQGVKAIIQGRDIGTTLISTIKKMKASDVSDLAFKLSSWFDTECQKENAKKNPSDAKLIALQDRYECLSYFLEDASTVQSVVDSIEKVFSDDGRAAIVFSSIHRAKGLEANRVFFLEPEGASCPHPMAKSEWQVRQEYNLRYVAITRAINTLVYVG